MDDAADEKRHATKACLTVCMFGLLNPQAKVS